MNDLFMRVAVLDDAAMAQVERMAYALCLPYRAFMAGGRWQIWARPRHAFAVTLVCRAAIWRVRLRRAVGRLRYWWRMGAW